MYLISLVFFRHCDFKQGRDYYIVLWFDFLVPNKTGYIIFRALYNINRWEPCLDIIKKFEVVTAEIQPSVESVLPMFLHMTSRRKWFPFFFLYLNTTLKLFQGCCRSSFNFKLMLILKKMNTVPFPPSSGVFLSGD